MRYLKTQLENVNCSWGHSSYSIYGMSLKEMVLLVSWSVPWGLLSSRLSMQHLSLLSNCQAQKSRNFLLCSKAQGSTRHFFQRVFFTPITNKSVFGKKFVESTGIIAEDLCVFRLIRSLLNQHRLFGRRGCNFRDFSSEISLINHNTQRRREF